jgi:hypothetical protein
VIKTSWKSCYRWLYGKVVKTMKAQLTNWSFNIINLNLISLLDFRKFVRYSEKFSAAAYELFWHLSISVVFDSLLLKTELSSVYFLQKFAKLYFIPPQICDRFISEYSFTRNHRIICVVVNHFSNQCIICIVLCLYGVYSNLFKVSWPSSAMAFS